MIQEKLKKDTQPDHDRIEELMFVHSIMDGTLSLLQYKKILTANYLIHAAWEDLLSHALSPQLASALKISRRLKLPALLADLQEVKMEPPPVRHIDWTAFAYDNDQKVIGALYVLEGATLGGHVIVKKLAVNPILQPLQLGFHYYQVYGSDLIPNWKLFCGILNEQPEPAYPLILAGARWMFAQIAFSRINAFI